MDNNKDNKNYKHSPDFESMVEHYKKKLTIASKNKLIAGFSTAFLLAAIGGATAGHFAYKAAHSGNIPVTPVGEKVVVQFITNGGNYIEPLLVDKGSKPTRPDVPEKEDYEFDGWYEDAGFTTPFDFNKAVTTSTKAYAKWKIPTSIKGLGFEYDSQSDSYGVYCKDEDQMPRRVIVPNYYDDGTHGKKAVTFIYQTGYFGPYSGNPEGGFAYCSKLLEIELPETMTYIADGAFSYCPNLQKVKLPNSIESIGQQAFDTCLNLSEINLNEGILKIDNNAFYGCNSLTKVVIPNSCLTLEESCFSYCVGLNEVVLGKNLQKINNSVFKGCRKLKTIKTIYSALNEMKYDAFYGCTNLDVDNIIVEDVFSKYTKGGSESYDLKDLIKDSIVNGNYYTTIRKTSFEVTSGDTKFMIKNLGKSEDSDKYRCSISANSDQAYGNTLTIPNEVSYTYGNESVTFEIENIADNGFYGYSEIQKIELPNSLQIIEQQAFCNCDALSEVSFSDKTADKKLIYIGYNAFNLSSNDALSKFDSDTDGVINIPKGVKEIGEGAFCFRSNTKITKINIPSSVASLSYPTYITGNSFFFPKSTYTFAVDIDNLYYKDVNGILFDSNDVLLDLPLSGIDPDNPVITLPSNTKKLGPSIFYFDYYDRPNPFNKPVHIIINESFEDFGESFNYIRNNIYKISIDGTSSKFVVDDNGNLITTEDQTKKLVFNPKYQQDGTQIKDFNIPADVTSIGENAFYCATIDSLTFAENPKVTEICENAFYSATIPVSGLVLPSSLKTIKKNAFYSSSTYWDSGKNQYSITIPESVETIEEYAFFYSGIYGSYPDYAGKVYIDSEVIANLPTTDSYIFGAPDNQYSTSYVYVYVKDTITLNSSSYLSKKFVREDSQSVSGYWLYTKPQQ